MSKVSPAAGTSDLVEKLSAWNLLTGRSICAMLCTGLSKKNLHSRAYVYQLCMRNVHTPCFLNNVCEDIPRKKGRNKCRYERHVHACMYMSKNMSHASM